MQPNQLHNNTKNLRRIEPWILLIGDFLAILLFVFLGQQEHETTNLANPLLGLLRAAFPFLLMWVIVAWALHALPRSEESLSLRQLVGRGVNAWLVAAPLALLLRAFLLDRDAIPVIFMLLTLTVGGTFIALWRLLFDRLRRRF
jgi:hypothetical protein